MFLSDCEETVGFKKCFYDGQAQLLLSEYLLHFRIVISFSVLLSLSHDGTDSPPDANDVVVILNNFKSKIIKVKVSLLSSAATVGDRQQSLLCPDRSDRVSHCPKMATLVTVLGEPS